MAALVLQILIYVMRLLLLPVTRCFLHGEGGRGPHLLDPAVTLVALVASAPLHVRQHLLQLWRLNLFMRVGERRRVVAWLVGARAEAPVGDKLGLLLAVAQRHYVRSVARQVLRLRGGGQELATRPMLDRVRIVAAAPWHLEDRLVLFIEPLGLGRAHLPIIRLVPAV